MCMHVHTFAMQTDAKHANYNYTVSCSCTSNSSCSDNFKFKNRICRNKKPGRTVGAGGRHRRPAFFNGQTQYIR